MSDALVKQLIDGRPADLLPVSDRAVQYGDGLFETISCQAGRPRWLELHLQRLRRGCERLGVPFDAYEGLAAEVASLAAEQARCIIKVIVTRGSGRSRGYRPSGTEQPRRIVTRHEWPQEADPARPLRVGVSQVRLGTNPRLAGLKHLNRLEQVLAQAERPEQMDEMLMLSSCGEVISGTMSNVFFADDRGLFTPDLSGSGVEGVMRRLVLESSHSSRNPALGEISIRPVDLGELDRVQEAFLTNVRWGVRSIGELAGRALSGNEYARQVLRWIDEADH